MMRVYVSALNPEAGGTPALTLGERIAYYAERFIGVPYDTDPLGAYVTNKVIVYDHAVDCMYHVFRSVELALASQGLAFNYCEGAALTLPQGENPLDPLKRFETPQLNLKLVHDPIDLALDIRFHTRGILDNNKRIVNYDDRFQYAEDMIESGKWGINITTQLSVKTIRIKGDRGYEYVDIISSEVISDVLNHLKSGDIIFFVKAEEKRIAGEIIGHLGIIKIEDNTTFLIHASGKKNFSPAQECKDGLISVQDSLAGEVKKIALQQYAEQMPFIGIIVTRF